MKSFLILSATLFLTTSLTSVAETIKLEDLEVIEVETSLEEAQEICGVEVINASKLDSVVVRALATAKTKEQLQEVYAFAFEVKNVGSFSKVRKLGVKVVSEIGLIGTARANLCQLLRFSGMRELLSVQGARKFSLN